jgi:hypothetical protein
MQMNRVSSQLPILIRGSVHIKTLQKLHISMANWIRYWAPIKFSGLLNSRAKNSRNGICKRSLSTMLQKRGVRRTII